MRWCAQARASARPGDAITRRFWVVPRPVAQWGNQRRAAAVCTGQVLKAPVPVSSRLLRRCAQAQAARASALPGDAITRRFGLYHGRLPSGAISGKQRPYARGRYSKHQSQYLQGFCAVRASASRTNGRATGRCNNAPFLGVPRPVAQWGNQRQAAAVSVEDVQQAVPPSGRRRGARDSVPSRA